MNANELRIGNWVKIKDDIFEEGREIGYDIYKTNEFQITGFNDGSSMKGCKVICFYEIPSKVGGIIHSGCRDIDMDPIPLTEEWLIELGFKKGNNSFYHKNGWLDVSLPTVHYSFDIWRGNEDYPTTSDWSEIPLNVDYVHQLQNLYFALTGKELELKSE